MAKLPKEPPPVFLKVAIAIPVYSLFDYLPPSHIDGIDLVPGIRLEVPFANKSKIAYLIEVTQHSDIDPAKLRTILRIIDSKPLISIKDLKLLKWASGYYHYPLGEVINSAFPANLRQGKPEQSRPVNSYVLTDKGKFATQGDLHRSAKQQQLLAYFQQQPSGNLSIRELKIWQQNWRPVIKALLTKELISKTTADFSTSLSSIFENQPNASVNFTQRIRLNPEQVTAINSVKEKLGRFAVFLLDGVTGSGKTEVYMQLIQLVLQRNQQVLVLVPEINLTPQLEDRFRRRFSVAMTLSHSNLTDNQRQNAWLTMQKGQSAILLGTRSALFTPLLKPGLIILDEEHDASFKQQEGFRFSARDVAVMRGKLLNIPVLLGSATPSLESMQNAYAKRYRHLKLTQRAGKAKPPTLCLLDIRGQKLQSGLSEHLLTEIRAVLANKGQVLLFLNRRGFAPTLTCHSCGWVARCQYCDANMVIHNQEQQLRCHHCGNEQPLPKLCFACKTMQLVPLGLGTERIEDTLRALFPSHCVIRMDKDTTLKKGVLENYLALINDGKADIILGTQMLAKGHHFPNVTLVALVDVDSRLFSIDFHSTERLAQMIIQVAGRAGRSHRPGKVILQTRHPDHTLLNTLINEGYARFTETALLERKQALLPPFTYHALLRAQAGKPELALNFLQTVVDIISSLAVENLQILGPVAAPMEKRAGQYRYQMLFQAKNRSVLQKLLASLIVEIDKTKSTNKLRWSLDVDPVDLF